MSRVMLNRWAEKLPERRAILDFCDFLRETTIIPIDDIDVEKAVDKFHEIDQAQLERERRELLTENAGAQTSSGAR